MFWAVIISVLMATESSLAVTVTCPTKRFIVILFQPVTLRCNFQTTASQHPVVMWKYKSYCRDPVQAALNPNSADNIIAQNNPNYNPTIECGDSQRTVRTVASKQGEAVTLGKDYTGRKISITDKADLNIAQTAWGDSGVYFCSVVSSQDLTGTNEDYTELLVLERKSNTTDLLPGIDLLIMEDWLLVVLVVLGFLLLLLMIGICWCQCCPHTCCCYVSCPCCPDRCCCPRALYEAGKAVKKGMANQYAGGLYAPSTYAMPIYGGSQANQPAMALLPLPNGAGQPPPQNGYGYEYDGASSVGQGSQVPLLHGQDGRGDPTRSGYRIQVDTEGNATRAIYYMEKELATLDPARPAGYRRLDNMSEVSSLHDMDSRARGGRPQPPSRGFDPDDAMSTISSVSSKAAVEMIIHAAATVTRETVFVLAPWTTWTTSDGETQEMTTLHTDVQMSPEAGEDLTTGAAALAAATTGTTMTAGAGITLPAVKDEEGEGRRVTFPADAAGVATI
ncbi:hypothetical protein OJAV_G00163060 [Oryzias javanicus]|uniref:Ig-like domain-containing protein n=1 Tax=Oryzias javanicus TaxID=123683 RepID=A0A3S2PK62_ORYJA|nr:hypothetical protein OJAV_G00163060 [Oryzias javanicus]